MKELEEEFKTWYRQNRLVDELRKRNTKNHSLWTYNKSKKPAKWDPLYYADRFYDRTGAVLESARVRWECCGLLDKYLKYKAHA